MIFQESIIRGSRVGLDQYNEVRLARQMANNHNTHINRMAAAVGNANIMVNEGIIPQEVYQEFDNVTVERFRLDDGDVFLNDLLPNSRSVSIGKLISKFRRTSDAGRVQTSMTGQIGIKMDQTEFNYDGALVPIHDTGFFRNWRELDAQRSEDFDALIDDQRECVASIRQRLADSFLDGHKDTNGQFIELDGVSWQGMRNDSRVAQVNIGASGINFDFTDQAKTGAEIKAAFIQVRDVLRITNKCGLDADYYISLEIESNLERKFSTSYDSKIIMQELADLMGVKSIKSSNKLSGNELMAFVNSQNHVLPVVGMGINTVALPRQMYNSNHEFAVWAAAGWKVKTDYFGNTCAMFAQDLG